MNTMLLEMGVFNIALVLLIYVQIHDERKKNRDCKLFGRLLLSLIGILFIDTLGWLIDGKPIGGQIWITTLVDGLDLILTTTVCWCWLQYALFIADERRVTYRWWYKDFGTIIFILQIFLVISSQFFNFYFYVDEAGIYQRGKGYFIHSLISLALLAYSSAACILAYKKTEKKSKKKELLFVALIILIPVAGNIFQLYVYGYPTVWVCTVFMVMAVYIHIQNKRINKERNEQNGVLIKALVEAQAANEDRTEFFSRMSHDMRTPMNGILGMIRLSKTTDNIDEIHENMYKAESAGEYMLNLINDTLDLQRLESQKMKLDKENVYIKDYFTDIYSMMEVSARQKGITFRFNNINLNEDQYVEIDRVRVKQIFTNLISNAIKFTPPSGTVVVDMEMLSENENTLYNRFTVRDTGVGMSHEFIKDRLYKPYCQENNEITSQLAGSGLGLAITRNLVEIMGGRLEVESELGEGTAFKVYINFKKVSTEIARQEKLNRHDREKGVQTNIAGKRLLLCEDHPLNAEIAIRLLDKAGCMVDWEENGKLGVDRFIASDLDYYDAILMDIRMPVMDGLTAAKTIRRLNRADAEDIPIIAMTANAFDSDVRNSLEAGMNAHLAKPINPAKLYATIHDCINN